MGEYVRCLEYWFPVPSHFLHLLQFPADYHVISISGSVIQLIIYRKPNEDCKILHYETFKSKKALSFSGALHPRTLTKGTLTPLGALPPDPRYRLALPRSPYLGASLRFVLPSPVGLKFWRWLKVSTFIYRHLQLKPWPAAVYNSKWRTDRQWHKWRSASSGSPLPEWTEFGHRSLQPDRPTYVPASRTMTFTPQCSLATTCYF